MYFDIVMPLTLFMVTVAAMLLEKKAEGKFKGVLQERELRTRDVVLLVAAMAVTVSLIIFVPQMGVMLIYLFSYSMLLFIFTYIFSDFQKDKAKIFSIAFLIISFLAAIISLFNFGADTSVAYGALVFFCLAGFTFLILVHEENRANTGERWYFAVLPPALFICLYIFFSRTPLWFPYLLDLYGIVFAVLIILYLGILFTWKTSLIFVGLLTGMDIILVLFTGAMVSAASHVASLRLPVLVSLPTVPAIATEQGTLFMGLGLGDFFFAGLLAIQTSKKYGRRLAVLSIITMTISFFIFETFMLTYKWTAFPGTLMIICGWLPVIILRNLKKTLAS
jgi:hypothetical protein